jgi:hypothetical protein
MEKWRVRVFMNKVLRRIFGPKNMVVVMVEVVMVVMVVVVVVL